MSKLLHLTAAQIFMLFIGLPILLNILDIVFSPSAYFSYYYVAPVITLIGLTLLFVWYWTVGVNIFQKLPQGMIMHLTRFKVLLLVSFCLLILTFCLQFLIPNALSGDNPADWFFLLFVPQILSMPCMFYCIYFIAKALKASEVNRTVTSSDYSSEFLMLLFLPVGVWFIQPRINKLFDGNQEYTIG